MDEPSYPQNRAGRFFVCKEQILSKMYKIMTKICGFFSSRKKGKINGFLTQDYI